MDLKVTSEDSATSFKQDGVTSKQNSQAVNGKDQIPKTRKALTPDISDLFPTTRETNGETIELYDTPADPETGLVAGQYFRGVLSGNPFEIFVPGGAKTLDQRNPYAWASFGARWINRGAARDENGRAIAGSTFGDVSTPGTDQARLAYIHKLFGLSNSFEAAPELSFASTPGQVESLETAVATSETPGMESKSEVTVLRLKKPEFETVYHKYSDGRTAIMRRYENGSLVRPPLPHHLAKMPHSEFVRWADEQEGVAMPHNRLQTYTDLRDMTTPFSRNIAGKDGWLHQATGADGTKYVANVKGAEITIGVLNQEESVFIIDHSRNFGKLEYNSTVLEERLIDGHSRVDNGARVSRGSFSKRHNELYESALTELEGVIRPSVLRALGVEALESNGLLTPLSLDYLFETEFIPEPSGKRTLTGEVTLNGRTYRRFDFIGDSNNHFKHGTLYEISEGKEIRVVAFKDGALDDSCLHDNSSDYMHIGHRLIHNGWDHVGGFHAPTTFDTAHGSPQDIFRQLQLMFDEFDFAKGKYAESDKSMFDVNNPKQNGEAVLQIMVEHADRISDLQQRSTFANTAYWGNVKKEEREQARIKNIETIAKAVDIYFSHPQNHDARNYNILNRRSDNVPALLGSEGTTYFSKTEGGISIARIVSTDLKRVGLFDDFRTNGPYEIIVREEGERTNVFFNLGRGTMDGHSVAITFESGKPVEIAGEGYVAGIDNISSTASDRFRQLKSIFSESKAAIADSWDFYTSYQAKQREGKDASLTPQSPLPITSELTAAIEQRTRALHRYGHLESTMMLSAARVIDLYQNGKTSLPAEEFPLYLDGHITAIINTGPDSKLAEQFNTATKHFADLSGKRYKSSDRAVVYKAGPLDFARGLPNQIVVEYNGGKAIRATVFGQNNGQGQGNAVIDLESNVMAMGSSLFDLIQGTKINTKPTIGKAIYGMSRALTNYFQNK